MFDDFRPNTSQTARKRMGGSMVVAIALYAGLIALVVGGTTAAKTAVVAALMQVLRGESHPEAQ